MASFLKFMTVDLFERGIIRNNLGHVSSKMVKFETSTFSGPPFCFYANFCNFCPNFVIHWSIFLMLLSKCSEKLWLYCKMSSNSTLIKTYSPACQKEKNTIFHKVHSPHSGCHSNQTMLLSYTKWPGYDAVIFNLLETIYFCKVIGLKWVNNTFCLILEFFYFPG